MIRQFLVFLVICFCFCFHALAQTERTYFDADGNPTRVKKAAFYREIVEGETGWIQNDYYSSTGTLKLSASLHGKKPDVYHGQASWFRENGTLQRRAQYVRGVQQGTDEYFDPTGRPVYTKIVNGERIGYAQYWSELGEPMLENGTGTIVFSDQTGTQFMEVQKGEVITSFYARVAENDTIYKLCDQLAILIGGENAFYKAVAENMAYPVEARRWGLSGKIDVEILIGKSGAMEEVRILTGEHDILNEEAIRVVKEVNPSFAPAVHQGKPVKSIWTVPIIFGLSN